MDWIASALTWIGNFILIKTKKWYVFIIFAVGNTLWMIHWYNNRQWAAFLLVGSFLIQNVWGIIKWRKEENEPGVKR